MASLPPRPLAQGGALEGVELTLPSVAELRKRTRGLFLHALVVPSRLLSRAVSDAERRAESIHLVSDLVKSLPVGRRGASASLRPLTPRHALAARRRG